MNIAVFGSKIWERFCDILGAPEWITDERYHDKPLALRQPRLAQCARSTSAWPRTTGDHWIEQFNEGGVACGLINDMREVFEEPQVQHLGMVKEVVSTRHGPAAPGGPAGATGAHAQHRRPRRAAPRRAHARKSCSSWA